MSASSTLIIVPTYNERNNIVSLIARLAEVIPGADILIVDDNSPDGTGAVAEMLAAKNRSIHVLHRAGKEGLGRAYVAGFSWGLLRSYERLIQMDADLSHDPAAIPALLQAVEQVDFALGSRYVPGGGTVNWSLTRRLLSRLGNTYARQMLGLPLRDLTGGFKCWRREVLESIDLPTIRSNGYSFQIEMTWRALRRNNSVREVPIVFSERREGTSKMHWHIAWEALSLVWRLRQEEHAAASERAKCSADKSAFS